MTKNDFCDKWGPLIEGSNMEADLDTLIVEAFNAGRVGYSKEYKRFMAACCAMQGLLMNPRWDLINMEDAVAERAFGFAEELLNHE